MKYLFGNWKMYLSNEETMRLAKAVAGVAFDANAVTVAVFPNTLLFTEVASVLDDGQVSVGAQNVAWVPQGAYTGAVSAHLFHEVGAQFALVGHSERRYVFGEDDDDVRKKVEACLDAGVTPVVCVGETQEDVDAGRAEYRVKKQIMKVFEGLSLDSPAIVAYEPVWAISKSGTGVPCDPEDAAKMHAFIKSEIASYTDTDVPVVYGGSVKPDNIASYLVMNTIDGVLPGNASTKEDSFVAMVRAVESAA